MTKSEDGGAAFPGVMGPPSEYAPGMPLRDYFAAKAMQARLTGTPLPRLDIRHAIAADAYAIADAMLAARTGAAS